MTNFSEESTKALATAYTVIVQTLAQESALTPEELANLSDSGPRIARGLMEMIWTHAHILEEVEEALATMFPVAGQEEHRSLQPVIVGPVDTHSLCPHHLLPIVNSVIVGYIPQGRVIGLSKLPRILDALAHRAIVQEQYTRDILKVLQHGSSILRPHYKPQSAPRFTSSAYDRLLEDDLGNGLSQSIAVNVRAVHHCMICRGVKGRALTETEELSGVFLRPEASHAYTMFSRFVSTKG